MDNKQAKVRGEGLESWISRHDGRGRCFVKGAWATKEAERHVLTIVYDPGFLYYNAIQYADSAKCIIATTVVSI